MVDGVALTPSGLVGSRRGAAVGVAVWALVVVVAIAWAELDPLAPEAGVHAAPFYGRWGVHDLAGLGPAFALAVVLMWGWPALTKGRSVRWTAAAAGIASVAWALALAASGGVSGVWTPLGNRHGYLGVAPDLDAATFLRTYVDRLAHYPTHVKGHPPLMPLVLRGLDAVGLDGAGGAAVLTFVVWGLGVAAVVATVAELGGQSVAASASGPIAVLPAAVFAATTYDAFFTGATALTIAALVYAARRHGWRSDAAALVGGALAAACLHLSYGLAPLALVPAAVMARERRVRPLAVAAVGGGAVVAAFVAGGFWWLDGLEATRGFYAEGLSRFRPYGYFVFAGNPAALALAVGPVVAAGFGALVGAVVGRAGRARLRAVVAAGWPLLALAALVAVTAADLTGLSNAEVERIWLPFMPWLAVAAAVVVGGSARAQRAWLGASLALGLVLQAVLVTPW